MIAETQTIVVPVGLMFSLFVLWPIRAIRNHLFWKRGGMTRRQQREFHRRYWND